MLPLSSFSWALDHCAMTFLIKMPGIRYFAISFFPVSLQISKVKSDNPGIKNVEIVVQHTASQTGRNYRRSNSSRLGSSWYDSNFFEEWSEGKPLKIIFHFLFWIFSMLHWVLNVEVFIYSLQDLGGRLWVENSWLLATEILEPWV